MLSLSFTCYVSLTRSLCLSLVRCISPSTRSLSHTRCLPFVLSFSLTRCLSLSVPFVVALSHTRDPSRSFSLCLPPPFTPSLSHTVSQSLSLIAPLTCCLSYCFSSLSYMYSSSLTHTMFLSHCLIIVLLTPFLSQTYTRILSTSHALPAPRARVLSLSASPSFSLSLVLSLTHCLSRLVSLSFIIVLTRSLSRSLLPQYVLSLCLSLSRVPSFSLFPVSLRSLTHT